MTLLATVVDTAALLDTVIAAFVSGVGVTFAFSLAILGASRVLEANREGRTVEAGLYGALALLALLITLAAIGFGLAVMIE